MEKTMEKSKNEPRVMRERDVRERTGIKSRTGLYARISEKSPYYDPTFPRPFRIGKSAIGWNAVEIDAWIRKQMESRL